MSVVPPATPAPRHALGLPAGSVRALLALGVLGALWSMVLLADPSQTLPLEFVYLQILMMLILATFFAAHGKTIGSHISQRAPLGLPHGSLRFLLLGGYAGLAAYLFYHQRDFEVPSKANLALLLAVVATGFFLGHILTGMIRWAARGAVPGWLQDVQAWIAIVATVLLVIVALVYGVINPSLKQEQQLDLPTIEPILAAFVGFYFGARA